MRNNTWKMCQLDVESWKLAPYVFSTIEWSPVARMHQESGTKSVWQLVLDLRREVGDPLHSLFEVSKMADVELDCVGLSCPMPIVHLAKAARDMESGETISILASDLAFRLDLEAWARRTGHCVEEFHSQGEQTRALVRLA